MKMSENQFAASILANPYIAQTPTQKQAEFLIRLDEEGFYGGAAGGAKSSGLLMAALQFVEEPGYAALLIRKTYTDLSLPGALMFRAHEWLDHTDARWDGVNKIWYFPSGSTLTFGYLEKKGAENRYQSAEFQYVGFDELTQFEERPYRYLFSRLRRLKGSDIPVRMRSASNPGLIGHAWVKARFVEISPEEMTAADRFYIPAKLDDNPHIDQEKYLQFLQRLDPIRRAQLRDGNWEVTYGGGIFDRTWFRRKQLKDVPLKFDRSVRYWDTGATEDREGDDPDWSVGLLLAELRGEFYILDIRRFRKTPGATKEAIGRTAAYDGVTVPVRMEQEPGSSGKMVIDDYARTVLRGYNFKGNPSSGDKTQRALPAAAAAENNLVTLVEGIWTEEFLTELEAFPEGSHDDQVDAYSGAHFALVGKLAGSKRFEHTQSQ